MLCYHRSFLGRRLVAALGVWAVLALAKPPLVCVAGFIECSLPMAWWSARVRAGCRVFARGKVGYLAGWPTCAQLAWFPSRLPGWVKQLRFPFHEDGNLQRGVASRRNRKAVSISRAQHGVGELLVCHTELWGEPRATSCIDASEFLKGGSNIEKLCIAKARSSFDCFGSGTPLS